MVEEKLIEISPENTPYVGITWQVSDFCNFKCKYCNSGNWAGINAKTRIDSDYDKILQNMDYLLANYESRGYKAFKFYFSGGEPTVWPSLLPFINWLKERLDDPQIGINTNLSTSTAWWEKNHHLFHDVVASYHIDFANSDRYLKNLIFLQDKVNYLCSRMMMQEDRFDEVIAFGEKVRTTLQNYNIEWVPLFDDISINAGPWKYSEPRMYEFFETHSFESQTLLKQGPRCKWSCSSNEIYDSGRVIPLNGNRLVAERKNFFSGWQCNVDESLFINSTGAITAASCGQGPSMGNIYSTVSLISQPIVCRKMQCTCGTDIPITKRLNHG